MGCGGPSSVYLSTLSLGGAARIEYRPWEVESVPFVVTFGVISAVREGHDKHCNQPSQVKFLGSSYTLHTIFTNKK